MNTADVWLRHPRSSSSRRGQHHQRRSNVQRLRRANRLRLKSSTTVAICRSSVVAFWKNMGMLDDEGGIEQWLGGTKH
jgi:hypothetical protein